MAVKFAVVAFTNFCSNDCFYCRYSRDNWDIKRQRMTEEEILAHFKKAYEGGIQNFLLMGGTDLYFDDDRIIQIVEKIKKEFPDCVLFLSVGEKYLQSYQKYYEAGIDGYFLTHKTANPDHFEMLHSLKLAGEFRKESLLELKKMGYKVGTSVTLGLPYQNPETLAEDVDFLETLQPDFIIVEPFIPQQDTIFADHPKGDDGAVEKMLSELQRQFPNSAVIGPNDLIEM